MKKAFALIVPMVTPTMAFSQGTIAMGNTASELVQQSPAQRHVQAGAPKTKFLSVFGAEVIATAVLRLVIHCTTDERNKAHPRVRTAAMIRLTATLLISLVAPLTIACFNPARDLGPRFFSVQAGWVRLPFQVNGPGWWSVYIVAPVLEGLLGGGIYPACF